MGFREQLAALKEIDIADLELSEVATWPLAARRSVLVLVAALTLLLGYSMLLSPAFDALLGAAAFAAGLAAARGAVFFLQYLARATPCSTLICL